VVMDLTQYEILAVIGALVATWVKHKVDYSKLEAKVMVLESDNAEFKKDLKTLIEAVQEIKLLLAKNQVQ
jgi:mannose/fructose/N-acetylgalactosamine-specific phosphotransferase system component IID